VSKCCVNVMSECMKRFWSASYIICVAVCCGVSQCVVVTKGATEFAKTQGVYRYVALQCVAVCCCDHGCDVELAKTQGICEYVALQCVAARCSALQRVATCCSVQCM